MLKDDILQELENNRTIYLSGQELANRYGVSRNAVWKAVNSLKKEGYCIESVTNRGYILSDDSKVLSAAGIIARIREQNKNIRIYIYDKIDSTNNEAKRMLAANCNMDNSLIVCNEQNKGRARYGGSFDSPPGEGIYMSFIYRLNSSIGNPVEINTHTSAAVKRAVYNLSKIELDMKDNGGIYYNNMKIGGILIEAVTGLESGYYGHIISGVGINLLPDIDYNLVLKRNELIAGVTCELIEEYGTCAGF